MEHGLELVKISVLGLSVWYGPCSSTGEQVAYRMALSYEERAMIPSSHSLETSLYHPEDFHLMMNI